MAMNKTQIAMGIIGETLGNVGDEDAKSVFRAWLDANSIDLPTLRKVCERFAAARAADRYASVTLYEIRKAVETAQSRSEAAESEPAGNCSVCCNTGVGHVVLAGESLGRLEMLARHHEAPYPVMYVSSIPCLCARGDELQRRRAKSDESKKPWPRHALERAWSRCGFDMGMDAERFVKRCQGLAVKP